jgi:uncharacterized protein (DUF1015 family)
MLPIIRRNLRAPQVLVRKPKKVAVVVRQADNMANIKPLKAVIYNQDKIADLSKVVCPPYDVISSLAQEYYHELSPNNLIHILLGRDIPVEDKYQRAGRLFREWLEEKILIQDDQPAVYFYRQQYAIQGEKRTRLGFICLLHLGEKNDGALCHEHTRLAPKEDRFCLIQQVKANLSPIFAVFADKKRIIAHIYQKHIPKKEPFIEITDSDKITHQLWRLDDAVLLKKIEELMKKEDIFIADGHHRYEVAGKYRDLMRQKIGKITGEEDFNYILTYFTNTDPRGLLILPIHRLLNLDNELSLEDFKLKLKGYFDLEEVKEKEKLFFLMQKAGHTEHIIGLYKDKKYYLLRLKNVGILNNILKDRSKAYRSLDVSILNQIIFKQILGVDLDNKKESLVYQPDANQCLQDVDSKRHWAAFFLNPVKIGQIMSVALNSEKMPPKSTYFYPKVLSGLVINKFS